MHACECRASTQHRHASDVGLHGSRRRRARQTHGRVRLAETGAGTRGTNPHLKHALERRQYPLCGRELLSVYPPTDYTRQQRSAYGHTHADRPSASKCRRLPGKLEAARRAAKRKPRRPICTPPASACVRARHPTRARICVRVVDSDHALGVASQTLPDGRTAQARIPAATCAGWPCAAHARPTSDAEQSLQHRSHACTWHQLWVLRSTKTKMAQQTNNPSH